MKSSVLRIFSALLMLLIIAGSAVSAFADSAEPEYNFEKQTCYMIEVGEGYRYVGTYGDASDGFTDPENLIEPTQNYSEITDNSNLVAVMADNQLPASVDLSESKFFPPVGDQGWLGACASFSSVYYQFTYEMNKSRGIATTAENAASPMFVFNFLNAGGEMGTRYEENYKFLKEHGAPPQSMVPYDLNNSLDWHTDAGVWQEASKYRLESFKGYADVGNADSLITSPDDSDITHYKSALAAGKVLGFSTTITYWKSTLLKEHPDVPENSKFAGQHSVMYNYGASGEHRMAIVGYNDNIWTDINDNNKVDKGEMGAFKIVNSWGESYCNDGFVWVAYDALNYARTTVEGGYSGYRNSVIHSVTSCDVREYESGSDIYLEFTLNTSKRTQLEIEVAGEIDGTIKSKKMLADFSYQQTNNEGAFDGTQNPCDGTFTYCLDNVIEGLDNDDFEDYTWSITLKDNTEDNNPLTVKNIKLVNKTTGKNYTCPEAQEVLIDGDKREFFLKETSVENKVIYYTGYCNPILYYKAGNSDFVQVAMENNTEREKYVNKYVIKDCPDEVTLYFADENGNTDDNDGKFYKADDRINYYTTQGVADKFEITGTHFKNGEIDLDKLMKMVIHTQGGYEPYHYQMTIEELDTGNKVFRSYQYLWYIQEPGYVFKTLSGYKFSIEAMDHTGQITTYETVIYPQDLPFEFVELKTDESSIFTGESVRFTAKSLNEGVFSHGLSKNVYDFVIKDQQGNVCYTLSKNNDFADYNERFSETFVDFIPEKKGIYTISVSSTDLKKQTAEISTTFEVFDKIYGDANGDGLVDIKDVTALQKYLAAVENCAKIHREISDCDANSVISIKDATCIRKYLAKLEGFNRVGQVIEYIPTVTEPETQAPTEPEIPTDPVVKNIVTFTNSLNWSGKIYCYYWSDANPNMINWPGVAMTNAGLNEFSQTLYTFEVPIDATKVIFTNGSAQTIDIAYPGGEIRYYAEDVKVGNGYNVKEW